MSKIINRWKLLVAVSAIFAAPALMSNGTAHAEDFEYKITNVWVGCSDICCGGNNLCCEQTSCCCPR